MKEAVAKREVESGHVAFSVSGAVPVFPLRRGQRSVSGLSTLTCVQLEANRNILEAGASPVELISPRCAV